jgi:ABC-type lipoprotein export system ATPase subunit
MQLLTEMNRDENVTIVLVTHETDIAGYARRHVVFRDGLIASDSHAHNGKTVQP